jgi:hypothetical protein
MTPLLMFAAFLAGFDAGHAREHGCVHVVPANARLRRNRPAQIGSKQVTLHKARAKTISSSTMHQDGAVSLKDWAAILVGQA